MFALSDFSAERLCESRCNLVWVCPVAASGSAPPSGVRRMDVASAFAHVAHGRQLLSGKILPVTADVIACDEHRR